jgi:hypothetical protein
MTLPTPQAPEPRLEHGDAGNGGVDAPAVECHGMAAAQRSSHGAQPRRRGR